ncbi:MAG: NAD(+)/NADH kinase [Cytophagales bacterium]|nr:NAD(+)/NADH kinase [Rhizobacter sp.]
MPTPYTPTAPLSIVFNAASGHADAHDTSALIARLLNEAGRRHHIQLVKKGGDIPAEARRAVAQAVAQGGAVVAAGGDGTINAVAQAAHEAGCPLGVLPQGTFNYFSRTHRIPADTAEATRALLSASVEPVQVGLVNERLFLVNASLGLYPDMLEDREHFKARFGRNRVVALGAAVATALRAHQRLRLRIQLGDGVRNVRSSSLFLGNNRLQLQQVGLPEARAVESGHIAAVMLKPVGPWALLRLLMHGALGALGNDERVESFKFQRMTVAPWLPYGTRRVKVAADGEVSFMRTPLEFRVAPKPLYLLKPAADATQGERS